MIDIGITSEECHVVDTNLIVGICVLIQTLGNILYFRSLIGAARVNGNQIGNQPAVFQRIVGIGTMDEEEAAASTCPAPAPPAGYCGTLLTPMAANFNILPAALLELKDKNAVIKAQAPIAIILLVTHIFLMYTLGF